MKTQEIADFLSAELVGDGNVDIIGVAALDTAAPGELAYVAKSDSEVPQGASCLIVPRDFPTVKGINYIRVENPKLAFALAARKISPSPTRYGNGIHTVISESADVRTSHIGSFVTIGDDTCIGEGCQVGDGVRIGNNVVIKKFTVIHQNCVIYDNVEIGNECVIHAGTVIGADGFGYVRDNNGVYHQFPQIGTVVIEDNVEIGANCCVDRGALGATRIGEGTKIDNLVQIAHNVQIGKRVVIAAQSGIAGSSTVEDDVVIAGQVGIADHVRIRAGSVIGAKSSVFPNKIITKGVWAGIPVEKIDDYKRQIAMTRGLHRTRQHIDDLRAKIAVLEKAMQPNDPTRD